MPTSVGVGSYGKRWHVAKVTDVQDGVFGVSFMTPCRGKWKWGRTDEGEVEESYLHCWKPLPGQSRGERCGRPALQQQSITFEASDRSRSQPLALIQILASELSLAPIREIAR